MLRKSYAIVIVFWLWFFWGSVFVDAFELPEGKVLVNDLNVRRDADVNSQAFWKLEKGQKVKVKAINGQWYKVRLNNGKEGYVHYKYLDVKVFARVLDSRMNVRSKPDWNADIIADLRGAVWIRITNQMLNWYQVEFSTNTSGWVPKGALEAPKDFFEAWMIFQRGFSQTRIDIAPAQTTSLQQSNLRLPFQDNVKYSITSRYRGRSHDGTDFAIPQGTPLYAPFDCEVIKVEYSNSGYGNIVYLQSIHDPNFVMFLAHLSAIGVSEGMRLQMGRGVGLSGGEPGTQGAGRSTGPHLHLGVHYNGNSVDPEVYLRR